MTATNVHGGTFSRRRLGRGRSAVVDLVSDPAGHRVVHKIFTADKLAKFVHLVLSGAGNPYGWNPDAIQAAVARRAVLAGLIPLWFGAGEARLRLPKVFGWGWNDEGGVYEIRMEWVAGRPAALHHVLSAERDDEMRELHHEVMRPLQAHLMAAGFDGLVWQAGKGNPVASSNFLLEAGAEGENQWVWIDMESGVPALFPLDPKALFGFYLPKAIRWRRPMFDDVDVDRLRRYVAERRAPLTAVLGAEAAQELDGHVEALAHHQGRWHALSRTERGIQYALSRGRLDEKGAAFYRRHGLLWLLRVVVLGVVHGAGALLRGLWRLAGLLRPARIGRALWAGSRFLFSQRYRQRIGGHLVMRRIAHWHRRHQLTHREARYLRTQVRSEEAAEYITDFGIHMAIKGPMKVSELWVLPMLYGGGVISWTTMVAGIIVGGMMARTLYTLWRIGQSTWRGRERPWVALIVGALPMVGNGAYPAQILYTSTEHAHRVAKFILYDLCAAFGRRLPIWGGRDTMTEHFFGRWPDALFARETRSM